MKDLQLDDGAVEGQINRTVSRRGVLRLAAVAAGGSVAALACGVKATPVPPTPIPATAAPPPGAPDPRPGSESLRTTPGCKQDRWSSRATAPA